MIFSSIFLHKVQRSYPYKTQPHQAAKHHFNLPDGDALLKRELTGLAPPHRRTSALVYSRFTTEIFQN